MPVVLGAAHKTVIRDQRDPNNPLLLSLLLGEVHGRAGGCLCLWELMRLIPVFHALNYFREEINGVKQQWV